MPKEVIHTAAAPAPIGPYSQAIRSGDMLFVSGQIALDPSSGQLITDEIGRETDRVMKNLEAILKDAGFGFNKVVKTTIFLRDMNDFPKVNEVYGKYFTAQPPARETVQVSRLPKDVNVEISCIATS